MRFTAIILLTACLQVSANSYSQAITLSLKNAPLEKIFMEIEKQVGYSFVYARTQLEKTKNIDVELTNVSLEKALAVIFQDQPLIFTIQKKFIVIKNKKGPTIPFDLARISIKGKIVNDKGEPMAGVTVTIKGTIIRTATNEQGEFTLTGVDTSAILVITGANIESTEWKVNNKTTPVITVKTKVTELGKVTVTTAMGIEKQTKELGYSVTRVSGEELNRTNPTNVLTALAGRVTGLNISTMSTDMNPKMRVLLRGIRSLTSNTTNQPLFVLNGSPLSFGSGQNAADMVLDFINNINPNDIDNVTVIKGANGAALYGPEGVNGVIVITTKKGNKGKPIVSLRNSTAFNQIDWRNINFFQTQFGSGGNLLDQFGNGLYDPLGTSGFWGPAYNGEMVPIGRPDEEGNMQYVPYRYTNDRRHFFQTAISNQTNLSVSQADAKAELYFNLGYTRQTGTLPKDKQSRAVISLNTARHLGKVSLRINMNYTRTIGDRGPNIETESFAPHIPITSYKNYLTDRWSDRNHYWSDIEENPYERVDRLRTKRVTNALFGNLEIVFRPFHWLTVTDRVGLNYSGFTEKGITGPLYYSNFAKTSGRSISSRDRFASVSETMTSDYSINNDLLITGLHKKGDFNFRTLVGGNVRENQDKYLGVNSGELAIPVYNISFAQRQTSASEVSNVSRSFSFFGSASIGYKDRVFLEITGRDDWDSKLAVSARGKNFYYGANTSVVLTEVIPALSKIKWLSTARLRASVTRTANMNIEPHQSQRLYNLANHYPYGPLVSYLQYGGFPNPQLKPENVISQEYGGSFSFFKNRIVLDFAYYTQVNDGMILPKLNSSFSAAPTTANAGKFRNYGWEMELKVDPLFKLPNGFSCTIQGGIAFNDNKVLSLYGDTTYVAYGMPDMGVVARLGHRAFEYMTFDWQRDPAGRVVVDGTTGMPSVDYSIPKYSGRIFPKYIANMNLNLSWKNLHLGVLAEYRGGHNLYDGFSKNNLVSGRHPLTTQNGRQRFIFPNSVIGDGSGHYRENTDVLVQSAGRDLYNRYGAVSGLFVTSSAFWKIRELTLSYDWTMNSRWAQKLNLGLYCRNPFAFYPNGNMIGDPELVSSGLQFDRSQAANGNVGVGAPRNIDGAFTDFQKEPGAFLYGFTVMVVFK